MNLFPISVQVLTFVSLIVFSESTCKDSTKEFRFNGRNLTCNNYNVQSRAFYCNQPEVQEACPETCGICPSEQRQLQTCEDSTEKFVVNNKEWTCDMSNVKPGNFLCKRDEVKALCPLKCEECTPEPPGPGECEDKETVIVFRNKRYRCTSKKISPTKFLCKQPEIQAHCPLKCETCTPEPPGPCEDSTDPFESRGKTLTCAATNILPGNFMCKRDEVKEACPLKCEECTPPVVDTKSPTSSPSSAPSAAPSSAPSSSPSSAPSSTPSAAPSAAPSSAPSSSPSSVPSSAPSSEPSPMITVLSLDYA